ncbi:MAG TPA: Na/Pi cotransporter family protein [Tissierellaceae bacterium]|nr:Na/Pi cotransporter family protein [Tissierellaceae bacterium]
MDIALPVMGGLGLFLYGMNIMGSGLEKVAGRRLNRLVEVLTTNRFRGVLVGALVTMVVQSSSATTVMVIGFVNAGLMTLYQAVGVIMGANIGTTITAQMIALNLTDYAPIAVAIGVALWTFTSKKKAKNISEILIGFGILFIGMDMMSTGLKPLANHSIFINMIGKLNNPLLGVLAGILLTTIVQSSSASIGLLQALAGEGILSMNIALPVLLGENIGTTTTALISSIGANITAKRAALMHFLFNLVGTLIFMIGLRYPLHWVVTTISPNNIQAQIANAHTIFNIMNVLIQIPFANLLVKLVETLIPGTATSELEASIYLDSRILETPSIALGQANKEVSRMADLVMENLNLSEKILLDNHFDGIDEALDREQMINTIEREITEYLIRLSNTPLSDVQHKELNNLLYAINDIERVGDHVDNIIELSQEKLDKNVRFSQEAKNELYEMFDKSEKAFLNAIEAFKFDDKVLVNKVLKIEENINILESKYREEHLKRLNSMECQTEPGIIFLDTISNLERVSDHSVNITKYVLDKFKK